MFSSRPGSPGSTTVRQDSWKLTVTSGRANDWRNRGCNILDRLSNSKSAYLVMCLTDIAI
jgi:hypothetical protein